MGLCQATLVMFHVPYSRDILLSSPWAKSGLHLFSLAQEWTIKLKS
jgi:hypothetical protein